MVKKGCKEIMREHIPEELDKKTGKLLTRIMFTCPYCKILDYPYAVSNGEIKVELPVYVRDPMLR
jgi:hypothetical protein